MSACRRHRGTSVFVAAVVLFVTSVLLQVGLPAAKEAHATCNGAGSPIVLTRYDNSGSYVVGRESVAYPGTTCDSDYVYSGAVLDAYNDGSCITAYYLEVFQYFAAQGTSCTTGVWTTYSYGDVYGGNDVFVNLAASYSPAAWVTSRGY
jgi:hypothetical protein